MFSIFRSLIYRLAITNHMKTSVQFPSRGLRKLLTRFERASLEVDLGIYASDSGYKTFPPARQW